MDKKELQDSYDSSNMLFRFANLSGVNLSEVSLKGADLSGANLGSADLFRADFRGVQVSNAILTGADLTSANLEDADLSYTDFADANLVYANLSNADLTGAIFARASLSSANFTRAILNGVNLGQLHLEATNFTEASLNGAAFMRAYLEATNLAGANLIGANFTLANLHVTKLRGADLTNADLSSVNVERTDLEGANLTGAILIRAHIRDSNWKNTIVENVSVGQTHFVSIDLSSFCSAGILHEGPSIVDYTSILLSIHLPNLKHFLLDTGMPEVFAEYMISCARSLSPRERFTLMLSTFISYGGPDEEFARRLNQTLKRNGVHTFFYPLDAKLGQRNASVMHRGIKEHDRVVLICSEASLTRPGVLTELTEVMDEEARRGGETCLIPIRLDNYVLGKEFLPSNPDLKDLIIQRVVGDFCGADKDHAKFKSALPQLIHALQKPVEIPRIR